MAPGRMMIGFRGGPGTGDPGQMTFNNVSLKDLIQAAWDVKAYQITGPSSLESARFDITAKVPKGATKEQSRLMLQSLLEDRFKLKLHHSTREQPIYALMVAKNGPKLKESVEDPNAPPAPDFPLADGGGGKAVQHADDGPVIRKGDPVTGPPAPPRDAMRMMVNNGRMKMASDGQTMARFVDMLGMQVDRPVVDMTALKGNYDISLEFAPDMALMQSKMAALGAPPPGPAAGRGGSDADSPDAQNAPGIFTALQEQLGLRLDPKKLAKLRDPRVKASEETIRKSLEGNWRPEHILALKQRLSLYRSHRELIDECDREIEKLVVAFEPKVDPAEKPLPEDRKQKQRKRKKKSGSADFNMRAEAYKLFGVDLTQIPGLMTLVFMLFSEVGRDMSRWPTAAHFVSWLGLCPDNDISGGKVLWRGARRTKNRAGTLFRLAAHSLHRDQTPMGDYLRRMKTKLGPAAATTATAHKIAIIFYTMVSKQVEYDVSLWANRDQIREKRIEARLQKQAAQRGYKLVPLEPAA